MAPFRISAKCFSLTYPRCNANPEHISDAILDKYPNEIQYLAIGQEKHEDGGLHCHAMVLFKTKKNLKDATAFNVICDGMWYHPNTQATKDRKKWFEYITKEGIYIITPINY